MAEEKGKSEIFFIGIEDHTNLRRELLNASKSLLISLRNYESLKENRKTKIELISELKTSIKSINSLVIKLKKYLPETKVRALPSQNIKRKEISPVKKKTIKKTGELNRLEQELKIIESRLTKMQ